MKLHDIWYSLREKGWVPLKYLFSSGIAFLLNWLLFVILDFLLGQKLSWEFSTIPAWIISSFINFTLNRLWVFRSVVPLRKALPEYYSLAVIVYLIKTYLIMEICNRLLHMDPAWAMPIAEVVLFVSNYFIQKKLIFKKKA